MKNSMKKPILYLAAIFGLIFVFTEKAMAVCPVCTVAVGAGVGLSRWLGIDDSITGLWVGGLIVSIIIWTISWFDKKNIKFKGRTFATILGCYFLIIAPLYFMGIIGNPLNALCSCGLADKLFLGIIIGSIAFWFGAKWYYHLKEKNQNRAHFPFQKVVMPIIPLILLSIIFYFLTK